MLISDSATTRTQFPVSFIEFNNKGKGKYVEDIKDHQMGVQPPYNFPFVNTVEIIFKVVDKDLAKKMGIRAYRCKQRVHSEELWERDIKNGDEVNWHSNQSLVLNLFGKSRWVAVDKESQIELGHTRGQPKSATKS